MVRTWSESLRSFSQSPIKVIGLCLLLSLAIHAPFMDMPPNGNHLWRQCNTLSVARNFYEEDMNILRPRIDRREDTDGVTGMQFPSYEFLVACGYQAFGQQDWVHRTIQFVLFGFGLIGFYLLVWSISENRMVTAIAAWLFCWSPELIYYGITALPDVLALSATIWGFYHFNRFLKTQRSVFLLWSGFLLALGGATKLQYLAIGGAMLVAFVIHLPKLKKSSMFLASMIGVGVLAISFGWYHYADQLIKSSRLGDFVISVREFPETRKAIDILINCLQIKIPEQLIGYGASAGLLAASYFGLKNDRWKRSTSHILLGWSLVLLIYFLLELAQMEYHTYYMMPLIPLFCTVSAFGIYHLLNSRLRMLVPLLLIAAAVFGVLRIVPGWMNPKIGKQQLLDLKIRNELISQLPKGELVVAGEDASEGIYLYFLHAKGWGFSNGHPLTQQLPEGETNLGNYVRRGATVLVSDRPANELKVASAVDSTIFHGHGFWIYRLKSEH